MFRGCTEYNHDVIIPECYDAIRTYLMLAGCRKFNSKIIIKNEVTSADCMFTTHDSPKRRELNEEKDLWKKFEA